MVDNDDNDDNDDGDDDDGDDDDSLSSAKAAQKTIYAYVRIRTYVCCHLEVQHNKLIA